MTRRTARSTMGILSHLADGVDRAAALRGAKLNYLSGASVELSHPFYWAALVLQGKDGAVTVERRGLAAGYYWLLGLGVLSVITLGVVNLLRTS